MLFIPSADICRWFVEGGGGTFLGLQTSAEDISISVRCSLCNA